MNLNELLSREFLIKTLLQLRDSLLLLKLPYIIVFIALAVVWVISMRYNILIDNFFREPAAILGFNPFLGVMSNLGVLLWAFSSAISLFAAVILLKKGEKKTGGFLLYAAVLTFVLLADDFCLLHERIFPRYLHIPEMAVYLAYVIAMLFLFIFFAKVIFQTDFGILLISCGFLALSIGSDLVLPQTGIAVLIEDGFKLLGIVAWLYYFVRTSYQQTLKLLQE